MLYVLPTLIAFRRRHPDRWLIGVTNLLLGATGVGWVAALTRALRLELPAGAQEPTLAYAGDPSGSRPSSSAPWGAVGDVRAHPSQPLTPGAAVAEIERLGLLRTAGHLSEVEFADLKGAVLRRMQAGAPA